jgi:hypothetical protein
MKMTTQAYSKKASYNSSSRTSRIRKVMYVIQRQRCGASNTKARWSHASAHNWKVTPTPACPNKGITRKFEGRQVVTPQRDEKEFHITLVT